LPTPHLGPSTHQGSRPGRDREAPGLKKTCRPPPLSRARTSDPKRRIEKAPAAPFPVLGGPSGEAPQRTARSTRKATDKLFDYSWNSGKKKNFIKARTIRAYFVPLTLAEIAGRRLRGVLV